jgi:hypothetical protein
LVIFDVFDCLRLTLGVSESVLGLVWECGTRGNIFYFYNIATDETPWNMEEELWGGNTVDNIYHHCP